MAVLKFKMPDVGEGVTEGEVVQWYVAPGDEVREDDPMVEVMTDKATVTIGAPCDARVGSIRFEVGSVARVGEVIVTLETQDSDHESRPSGPAATAVGQIHDSLPGAELFQSAGTRAPPGTPLEHGELPARAQIIATPAVRRLAKENNVDLTRVTPSGPGGRITRDDVQSFARRSSTGPSPDETLEERTPIVGVRRKIAERMARSTATAAHFTFVEECNASSLIELRRNLLAQAQERGVRLTYLPFVIRAVTDALERHPVLNSAFDDATREIVTKKSIHIGIATATDAGLVVPVIKHANRRPLFELATEVQELTDAARTGSLRPDDLRGSTFTITSLGKRSGLLATPILNHPEVGILGVHRIKERPVVQDGEIVVGHVMLLSLSFDHRIVDGHVGAEFAYDVIETLENPTRLGADFLG